MTPKRPAPDGADAAKQRLIEAKQRRETERADADRKFWEAVDAEISSGALRQVDAVEALDMTRDYIRRNLKQLHES